MESIIIIIISIASSCYNIIIDIIVIIVVIIIIMTVTVSDILKDLIKNCKFETKQRDDIIIKQGEVGDRWVAFTVFSVLLCLVCYCV